MPALGDRCPDCYHLLSELSCGGLRAYCWYCEERAASPSEVPPPRAVDMPR